MIARKTKTNRATIERLERAMKMLRTLCDETTGTAAIPQSVKAAVRPYIETWVLVPLNDVRNDLLNIKERA